VISSKTSDAFLNPLAKVQHTNIEEHFRDGGAVNKVHPILDTVSLHGHRARVGHPAGSSSAASTSAPGPATHD